MRGVETLSCDEAFYARSGDLPIGDFPDPPSLASDMAARLVRQKATPNGPPKTSPRHPRARAANAAARLWSADVRTGAAECRFRRYNAQHVSKLLPDGAFGTPSQVALGNITSRRRKKNLMSARAPVVPAAVQRETEPEAEKSTQDIANLAYAGTVGANRMSERALRSTTSSFRPTIVENQDRDFPFRAPVREVTIRLSCCIGL
jgi:hypothetical protein